MNDTTPSELDRVLEAASATATAPLHERARVLRAVAHALDGAAEELVPLAREESHLPVDRLTGELARTTFQLRRFADLVVDGSCFDAVIEHADPAFPLGPRPDLRRVSEPIGPLLVFAASNFPFAFSVAGGDTAAALGAGCPVVVKAHPGHPALSARVATLAADAGAPLWLVHGVDAGRAALADPRIRAGAFTGSTAGGRVLFDIACGRPDPIPFYGELGSVNPVFVSPGAVAARGAQIVDEFVASFTLGVGQFCTKPGLLFVPEGHRLAVALVDRVRTIDAAPMLGAWIEDRYLSNVADRAANRSLATLHAGRDSAPTLLGARVDDIVDDLELLGDECFGPASIVVDYGDDRDILRAANAMGGSLTATVHAEPGEEEWSRPLLDVLHARAGRIVFNGWPTGVAVSPAMHHGGPWPATTLPLFGSVGGNAIIRFLRPVCFQNVPDALLPSTLQDANPLGIRRRVDGVLQ